MYIKNDLKTFFYNNKKTENKIFESTLRLEMSKSQKLLTKTYLIKTMVRFSALARTSQ